MSDRFRPLRVSELVDRSFSLYRENLLLFFAIAGCAYIPFGIFSVVLGTQIPKTGFDPAAGLGTFGAYFAIGGLFYLLLVGAAAFARGSLAVAVADRYLDLPITFRIAYRRTFARLGALLGALVLTSLAIGAATVAGCCLLFIPTIWVWMGLAFAPQAVLLEGLGATQALTRSWHLTRGDRGRIFGMLALTSVGLMSVYGTISFFANLLFRSQLAAGIMTQIGYAAVTPVVEVGLVLAYFDSRVRKEGFDLALLAAQLSSQASADPAAT